jgi:hypothetical protein
MEIDGKGKKTGGRKTDSHNISVLRDRKLAENDVRKRPVLHLIGPNAKAVHRARYDLF